MIHFEREFFKKFAFSSHDIEQLKTKFVSLISAD